MSSVFPCKTLLRKTLRHHWVLLLLACIQFMTLVFRCVETASFYKQWMQSYANEVIFSSFKDRWDKLLFSLNSGIFELLFSPIAALCAFSCLHKKQENHFCHSLPLKKDSLFVSSLLRGFLFYALPWLVSTLLSTPLLYWLTEGITSVWGTYVQGMVYRLSLYLIAYSIAVLATILSGRRFFGVLLTSVFHILFPLLELCLWMILENSLSPLSAEPWGFSEIFSPLVYLLEHFYHVTHKPWGALAIYVAVSLVLLLLSGFLHRKRKEEHVEQSLAFPVLTLFVQYFLTFLITFGIAALLVNLEIILSQDSSLAFPCLLLSPIGFFLSRMLLLKSAKVFQKKAFLQYGIFALCFLAMILFFRFDILGITKRVPKAENVERLTLSMNGMTYTTEDSEDIADFTQIHRLIVNNQEILTYTRTDDSNRDPYMEPSLHISYEKKGWDLNCTYTMLYYDRDFMPVWEALEAYFREGDRAKEQILQLWETITPYQLQLFPRNWYSDILDGDTAIDLSAAQEEAMRQALLLDMEEGKAPLILQKINSSDADIICSPEPNQFIIVSFPEELEHTCSYIEELADRYREIKKP